MKSRSNSTRNHSCIIRNTLFNYVLIYHDINVISLLQLIEKKFYIYRSFFLFKRMYYRHNKLKKKEENGMHNRSNDQYPKTQLSNWKQPVLSAFDSFLEEKIGLKLLQTFGDLWFNLMFFRNRRKWRFQPKIKSLKKNTLVI